MENNDQLCVLTWNARTLSGPKLDALEIMVAKSEVDVVVVSEAEVRGKYVPHIKGFTTHLPPTAQAKMARVVVFTRKTLHAACEATPADLPIVIVRTGTLVLAQVSRWALS